MKKKIKIILIALIIAIIIELGVIIAVQIHKIVTEAVQINTTEEVKEQTKPKKQKKKLPEKNLASSNISEPTKSEPEPEPVDIAYFDDAVFIGDSRTVGLRAFGSFVNSAYFAKTGISVNSFFMYPALDEETNLTLTQTLSQRQFKKVYIMIGVNDAAMVPLNDFETQFFDAIREIQL